MKITSVNIKKLDTTDSKCKAIASVLLNDCFAVHDIKIIEGDNGLFIAMPSKKTPTGDYRDIVHPINPKTRKIFEDEILKAYRELKEQD